MSLNNFIRQHVLHFSYSHEITVNEKTFKRLRFGTSKFNKKKVNRKKKRGFHCLVRVTDILYCIKSDHTCDLKSRLTLAGVILLAHFIQ